MKVNGKDDIPYLKWKIIQMFETTNSYMLYYYIHLKKIFHDICMSSAWNNLHFITKKKLGAPLKPLSSSSFAGANSCESETAAAWSCCRFPWNQSLVHIWWFPKNFGLPLNFLNHPFIDGFSMTKTTFPKVSLGPWTVQLTSQVVPYLFKVHHLFGVV